MHSPLATASAPTSHRRQRAAVTLFLGVGTAIVVVAWLAMPPLEPGATPTSPRTIDSLWSQVASLLPIARRSERLTALAFVFVVACAAASTWAVHQVLRGPGRPMAAIAAAPLTAWGLTHWTVHAGATAAVSILPATACASLSVAIVLRALVHFGRITGPSRTRALAAAALCALLLPRVGLPLLLAVGMICALRSRRARETSWRDATLSGLRQLAMSVGPIAIAAAVLAVGGLRWPAFDWRGLTVQWPAWSELTEHLPATVLYPGVALIAVSVLPLRWRGGTSLLALCSAALLVHEGPRLLVPAPAMLVAFASAATGWVWLAGSVLPPSRPRTAFAVAAATAVVVLTLGLWPAGRGPHPPLAAHRGGGSAMRLYERGLIAPGDAIAVAGPAFFRDLNDARQLEGWRPDVEFVDAATIDEPELMAQILLWDQHGRRVLSDSYSAGGRWTAQWVLDSGPLFWFVGEATQLEQDFTDLSRLLPEDPPSPRQHRLLTLMALERARYRRALNEPTAAVAALPLATDRRRSVVTRLQLSRSVRPYANQESELSMPADGSIPADALVVAEAGDLLFAHGEHDRGADLLLEAAAAGLPSALGALVRWQLRAGLDVAAWTTLETLVRGAEHRDQAIDVLHWMVARERYADASRLAVVLAEAGADVPSHAADEIAARLLLQRALAVEPGRPIVGPTNPTISRR